MNSPMSLHPLSPPPTASHAEPDLNSTAELPVLDAARSGTAGDEPQHGSTDTWILPPAAREALSAAADQAGQPEASPHSAAAAVESLVARLRETQELLAGRTERLQEVEHTRDEARAELAATAAQLAEARAEANAANARALQLERRLEEQHSEISARHTLELEQLQAQAARGRAQAASAMGDLHVERARAVTLFESLQSIEARRLIAEALVVDMQREAEARVTDLGRLGEELAGRDTQVREHGAELTQRAARIGELEQHSGTLTEALAQRDAQLRDALQEKERLQADVTRLQGETAASSERIRLLEALAEQQRATLAQQQSELEPLLAERASLTQALESARGESARALETVRSELTRAVEAACARADTATAAAAGQEAALTEARARVMQLEPALAAERQRLAQLEAELSGVRAEMEDWGGVLRSAQQERGGYQATIAAAEARARALEAQLAEQREALRELEAQSGSHAARARELEDDLHAAEDTVHRLESEARNRSAHIEELEKSNSQWRASAEQAPHGPIDSGDGPVPRAAAGQPAAEQEAPEPLPDGGLRLLIYSEDGREIAHVLGRKTSIGRTPDNDLQIEAKHVSRHHAVILVGPASAIIEDLNSTNGVLVNGRRIVRHTLSDGDQITIGRARYRFAVRQGNR
ncbi:MAG TPA: FHA domain-containing protein [Steroidobacteraceae bacterium]|nr:FHA domain-containing protein [Steroidobacteraceae bacterium]